MPDVGRGSPLTYMLRESVVGTKPTLTDVIWGSAFYEIIAVGYC
jgi:hypothetical protein